MTIQLKRIWSHATLKLLILTSLMVHASSDGAVERFPQELGLNHRAWTNDEAPRPGAADDVAGEDAPKPHRVIELRTGMNYLKDGVFVPSEASFEEEKDSFAATRIQHKVKLSKNLYTARAITIRTRDGITLKSTPSAIGLYDTASGRSSIIATLTNSIGVLLESNRVVFPGAFSGLCADVIYTVNPESFEQDVVITEGFAPRDYDFPDASTIIQIYTEFYDEVPEPDRIRRPIRVELDKEVRSARVMPDLVDEVLGFGEFVLATGRAMSTTERAQDQYVSGAPVAKEFRMIGTRRFLVESVDYSLLQDKLDALPECQKTQASLRLRSPGKLGSQYASAPPKVPDNLDETYQRTGFLAAQQPIVGRSGVVIDYIATVGSTLSTAFTFQGDATYLIVGPVIANGPVTLEGGAVIKFKHLSPATASIRSINSFFCKTSRFRPAFCTAVDDDSVGESMNGYANSGYITPSHTILNDGYANPALWFSYSGAQDINHVRFRYCKEAVRFEGAQASNLRHSQLVNCIRGIVINGTGSGSGSYINVENVLMAGVQYPITIDLPSSTANLYNTTIDGGPSTSILVSASVATTCSIVNGILANISTLTAGPVTLSGNYNGFVGAVPLFGNTVNRWTIGSSAFQVKLAGNYYLPANSTFRDKGTTVGLATQLIAELRKTTTEAPPDALTGTIAATTSLSPSPSTGRGDVDPPDLGYHYPMINAVLNNVVLAARLVLTNGVSVGLLSAAVDINAGGHVCSEGTALALNNIVSLGNVQEQPNGNPNPVFIRLSAASGLPQLEFRFTDFSIGQGQSAKYVDTGVSGNFPFTHLTFKDSRLRNATLNLQPASAAAVRFAMTNCLVERSSLKLGHSGGSVNTPLSVYFYNNTILGDPSSAVAGTPPALALIYDTGTINLGWEVRDNLFDKASQSLSGTGSANVAKSYNGFTTGTINGIPGDAVPGPAGDKTGFAVSYATGLLGEYYLPAATATLLTGSRGANVAGLYHYTTSTTAGTKELNTTVEIGFHYVSLTAGGQPPDQDSDASQDYIEDRNGDGLYGTGDPSSWFLSDTDSDGMPDGWEAGFALNPLLNDAIGDPDGDNVSNLWEYQLGLSPIHDELLDPAKVRNYTYDLANRLIGVTGKGKVTLTPDNEGNLEQVIP